MNISNKYSQKLKRKSRKCIFLDRDGVLIKNYGYVYKENQIKLLKGVFKALNYLKNKNYLIIVVTNQSGVARGYFAETDVINFHKLLNKKISNKRLIDKFYFCPYHPSKGIGKYKKKSLYRKPNNGMILKAIKKFKIDVDKSFMIGDQKTDYLAAKKSGLKFFYKRGCLFKLVKSKIKN